MSRAAAASSVSLAPAISGAICIVPLRAGFTLVAPAYPDACTALEIAQNFGATVRDTLDVAALASSFAPLESMVRRWGERTRDEFVLTAANGRAWRVDAAGQGTTLRVTERDGREIVRWVDDEFREDAAD